MHTLREELTVQFYEWERLGRGWMYAAEPIDLEPPFTPFFGHLPRIAHGYDDGVRPTALSSIASLFQRQPKSQPTTELPAISYDLYPFDDDAPLVPFRLHIPKSYHASATETIAFLIMLSYCKSPVSVELVATPDAIRMQIVCREQYASYVKGQLQTYFHGVNVSDDVIQLSDIIDGANAIAVTDFGLSDEFMRPIAMNGNSTIDSFTGIVSILDHLQEHEGVILQILFNGVVNQWEQSILRSVSDNKQGPFFANAPEMLPMAKEKISSPLFAATIRLLTQADTLNAAEHVLRKLCFAITQASKSSGNSLIPLPHPGYTIEQRVSDIVFRESGRVGMLLNARELATFVHIPSVQSKKLFAKHRRTKELPAIAKGHEMVLGINEHDGKSNDVTISAEQRLRHMHIIGATGTGKSTLQLSMIVQDIEYGNGIAVLDPHGDLIESILSYIPEKRIHDVIIIDPADSEYPIGFNILHAHSDIEKEILSSDLVASFRRNSTSWGDQMNSVFSNTLIAFLESTKGGTLADVRRFLIEKDFRESFLQTVTDPSIRYYWQKEYGLLKSNSVGPILTRLDTFLRPKLIRNMVCQQKGLNFEDILNTKKILLVKLSQGLIGTENSYLLGSLVVAKTQQAALARQAIQQRNDFFFYIDEFQHFITPSMEGILSGTRKYHLGLILAHQDMQQLLKYNSDVDGALTTNACTRICFRLGETDAKRLAAGFSYFESVDLQNLGKGEAIARIEKPEFDFSLTTKQVEASTQSEDITAAIIAHSRSSYATSKHLVEEELARTMQMTNERTEEKQPSSIQSTQPKEKKEPPVIPAQTGAVIPIQKRSLGNEQISKENIKSTAIPKEETQHRYLQTLIKKMAESRGYKATVEQVTPDSKGKVDVLLEKDNKTIACEVSVTTDTNWELHNIQKCLAAGYDLIVVCMVEAKSIALLKKKLQDTFSPQQSEKIRVFEPEAFFQYLDTSMVATPLSTETTMKGYRVKVNYDSITEEEMKRKKDSIAKIVADSLKKMKKE